MIAWKTALMDLLRIMALNTEHLPELVIALVGGFILACFILQKAGKAFGCSMTETSRSAAVLAIGLVVILAAVAALNIYAVPKIENAMAARIAPIALCAILLLGAVVPLAMFLLKGSYFKVLLSILLSVAAAAVLALLIQGAGTAIRKGGKDFGKTKDRTKSINEVL